MLLLATLGPVSHFGRPSSKKLLKAEKKKLHYPTNTASLDCWRSLAYRSAKRAPMLLGAKKKIKKKSYEKKRSAKKKNGKNIHELSDKMDKKGKKGKKIQFCSILVK